MVRVKQFLMVNKELIMKPQSHNYKWPTLWHQQFYYYNPPTVRLAINTMYCHNDRSGINYGHIKKLKIHHNITINNTFILIIHSQYWIWLTVHVVLPQSTSLMCASGCELSFRVTGPLTLTYNTQTIQLIWTAVQARRTPWGTWTLHAYTNTTDQTQPTWLDTHTILYTQCTGN